jgi:hypothetical protein
MTFEFFKNVTLVPIGPIGTNRAKNEKKVEMENTIVPFQS